MARDKNGTPLRVGDLVFRDGYGTSATDTFRIKHIDSQGRVSLGNGVLISPRYVRKVPFGLIS